jgi:hypothetical protein
MGLGSMGQGGLIPKQHRDARKSGSFDSLRFASVAQDDTSGLIQDDSLGFGSG